MEKLVQQAQPTELQAEKSIEQVKKLSAMSLLMRILIGILLLILLFLLYNIIMFIFPYIREKRKLKRALSKDENKIFIVVLFKFLCRILNMFGYKYPVIIDPEEHIAKVSNTFQNLRNDLRQITLIFLEARYSSHKIVKSQVQRALNYYSNILKELKESANFLQKFILKLRFIFKI